MKWWHELVEWKMRRDWDERARENARHYVATGLGEASEEEFYRSGYQTVAADILTDLENVTQGRKLKEMRVLEIGCGVGRVSRALGDLFGEVHAVDVSAEMVKRAREAVKGSGNVFVYQNDGWGLKDVPEVEFDFAYSTIVFQHVPSKAVVEAYVGDVGKRLRKGALFKFQVQGIAGRRWWWDTWHGVAYGEREVLEMVERNGFEGRYSYGGGTQYLWVWAFKR